MVNIFARKITDDLASLVKQVDNVVGTSKKNPLAKKGDKVCAFVILMTKDADAAEAKLKKLAGDAKVKHVPLTVFEGIAGPPKYKIAEKAEVTVMLWVKTGVKANHAFAKGKFNADGVKAVVKSVPKILPKKDK